MSQFRRLVLVPFDETENRNITTTTRQKRNVPSMQDVMADEENKQTFVSWSRQRAQAPSGSSRRDGSHQYITSAILSIPKKALRSEAFRLVNQLQKNPFIQWDDEGNVSLYDSHLPGANIADLIRFAVYPKNMVDGRKKVVKPPHWQAFSNALQRMPQSGSGYKRQKCPIHSR